MICEKMFHNISKVPEDTQEWLQKVHDSENFIDQKTEEFYESHLERINRGPLASRSTAIRWSATPCVLWAPPW